MSVRNLSSNALASRSFSNVLKLRLSLASPSLAGSRQITVHVPDLFFCIIFPALLFFSPWASRIQAPARPCVGPAQLPFPTLKPSAHARPAHALTVID